MSSHRILLGLVIAAAAGAAAAQTHGTLRWRAGMTPLGLQPAAADLRVQCGPLSLSCGAGASVPLYASAVAPRSLSMQLAATEPQGPLRIKQSQGLSLNLVGRAGILSDLGVYGRVGASFGRQGGLAAPLSAEGMNYGVGVSWDFSRGASAVLGFDSYDVRSATGELRDVRATSLGLQWRY